MLDSSLRYLGISCFILQTTQCEKEAWAKIHIPLLFTKREKFEAIKRVLQVLFTAGWELFCYQRQIWKLEEKKTR